MTLDSMALLFQNLNGAYDDVSLDYDADEKRYRVGHCFHRLFF